jgi:general secretion pathway protein G
MKQKGFSLIELLVVITILGILAAIGLTSYRTANMKARDSRRQADIQQIRSALEMYRTENNVYPPATNCYSTATCWTTLFNATYLGPYMGNQNQPIYDPLNTTASRYFYNRPNATTYTLRYRSEVETANKTFTNP